jgi:hypothetical protein
MAYLHHRYEPNNTTELTRKQQRAKAYQIIGEELYKTSLQRSHWSKGSRCKGVHTGFLLGIHNRRCCEACQNLPSMSKVLAKYSSSVTTHSTHHTLMATAKVGHRHSGNSNNSTRELQICSGSSIVFHKMGRGKASSQHSDNRAKMIFSGRT